MDPAKPTRADDEWQRVDAEVLGSDGSADGRSERERRVEAFFEKLDNDVRRRRQKELGKAVREMKKRADAAAARSVTEP